MKILLKLLSVLLMWGVVAYMVIYVDPETVRDVGIEGLYLPFVVLTAATIWYTVMMLLHSWAMAMTAALLVGLALVLSILQLMSWFTLLVILLLMIFALYLHYRRDLVSESEKSGK